MEVLDYGSDNSFARFFCVLKVDDDTEPTFTVFLVVFAEFSNLVLVASNHGYFSAMV